VLPPSQHANVHVRPKIARKESTVLASEVLGLTYKVLWNAVFHVQRGPRPQDAETPSNSTQHTCDLSRHPSKY
jgi:hypothetical protein